MSALGTIVPETLATLPRVLGLGVCQHGNRHNESQYAKQKVDIGNRYKFRDSKHQEEHDAGDAGYHECLVVNLLSGYCTAEGN